jgi:hypothetical protein
MNTEEAIDAFLKKKRKEADVWNQSYIPLQVKQENSASPQAGPSGIRDPSLQKRPKLEILIKTSSVPGERTVRSYWNRTSTTETQTEFSNETQATATQTDVLIDLTLDEPWTIEPSLNQPKIWDQEQLTKNLVAMTEYEILDILSDKGESDIKLTDSMIDQVRGVLTKLALQSQSVITKYNF